MLRNTKTWIAPRYSGCIYSYTLPPLAFLREPSSCLRSASRSLLITRGLESNSFSLYIRLFMRPLSIILGLLLCMIAVRGNELLVIKDSEAAQYVGKKVEVRGLVVSVTTSPLGTTFINFGREYPNQIFAGYIPAGSKRATLRRAATLQGKIIGITGTVELYKGKPEIKVLSMTQIKGVDSQLVQ